MKKTKAQKTGLVRKEGFNIQFDPKACRHCPGRCCNGQSGHIFVNREEIKAISSFLKMEPSEFLRNCTRKVSYKFSIKEIKTGNNYACIFFDPIRNRCTIYPVRPEQCRTFPFWEYFKDNPGELSRECPGVSFF